MASTASKLAVEKAKHRQSMANARRRAERSKIEDALIRKGTIMGTAGIYGTMNRFDVPVDLGGFPWKVAVAGLAWVGEAMSKGAVQSVMGGIGDATLAIYVERAITQKTLIAGEDDDDGDGEGEGGEL